jgi:hypothetical protein
MISLMDFVSFLMDGLMADMMEKIKEKMRAEILCQVPHSWSGGWCCTYVYGISLSHSVGSEIKAGTPARVFR